MKSLKIFNFFLVLLLFFSLTSSVYSTTDTLTILSPNYFSEQNNIFDFIHYLENEYLSFKFCSKDIIDDVKFNLQCNDLTQIDLKVNKLKDTDCYYSNYNLDNLSCSEFSLNINYNTDDIFKEITRNFKKQKESKLINNVLDKDYTKLSLEEISYYLLVLNNIQSKENIKNQEIYDYLKNQRDNINKCWPSNNCNLKTTTTILNNLNLAGYSLDSRLIQDGKIFLEQNIIDEIDSKVVQDEKTYEFEIRLDNQFNSSDINCDLDIDNGNEIKSYIYDDTNTFDELALLKNFDNKFQLECDENIDSINIKIFDDKLETKEYKNEDLFSYTLSDYNKNLFNEFDYNLNFNHSFAINEEINCDIIIDGDVNSYTFDENTQISDFKFEGKFTNDIKIECDENFDYIYFDVYADLEDEIKYENEDVIEYILNLDSSKKSFKYEYFFKYDFLSSTDELICELNFDTSSKRVYKFKDGDDLSIENRFASNKISLSCDKQLDEIEFKLYDIYNRVQIDDIKQDLRVHSFTIPSSFSDYVCIGKDKNCDFYVSLMALNIYGNKLNENVRIDSFVESMIQKEDSKYFIKDTSQIKDTSNFLRYKNNLDLINFIKISQNNDGSWGSGSKYDRVLDSSLSVLGLQLRDTKNSEYVSDGEKWIYFNEPISGWGDVEKDSVSYLAIKDTIKPYLKITAINEIKKEVELEFTNPTIYDIRGLKLIFDSKLEPLLKYKQDLGDLNSGESIKVNVSLSNDILGSYSGDFKLLGFDKDKKEIEFVKMPINIVGSNLFSFTDEKIFFSKDNLFMNLNYKNNRNDYVAKCTFKNPFSDLEENVEISSSKKYIEILNRNSKTGNYSIDFNCIYEDNNFIVPINLEVNEVEKSFSINSDSINIYNLDDFSFQLTNDLDDKQVVSFSIIGDLEGIIEPAEESKIIASKDTRDIFFKINNPTYLEILGNSSISKIVIESDAGYKKEIPIIVNLGLESSDANFNWIWIIISIFSLWLIIFVVRRYRNMQDLEYEENNQDDDIFFDDIQFK